MCNYTLPKSQRNSTIKMIDKLEGIFTLEIFGLLVAFPCLLVEISIKIAIKIKYICYNTFMQYLFLSRHDTNLVSCKL